MQNTLALCLALLPLLAYCDVKKIKVVESLHSYGGGTDHSNTAKTYPKMTPRVPPYNYTGPEMFRNLTSTCLLYNAASYEYRVCLFDNVTQHDAGNSWNPYHGILGTFTRWSIVNDTFHSMLFHEGDGCAGGIHRRTNVTLSCGSKHRVTDASEPSRCRYLLKMETPFACDGQLHVSQHLSPSGLVRFNRLQDELYDEEITSKGYANRLERLLQDEDLVPRPTLATTSTTTTTTTTTQATTKHALANTHKEELEGKHVEASNDKSDRHADESKHTAGDVTTKVQSQAHAKSMHCQSDALLRDQLRTLNTTLHMIETSLHARNITIMELLVDYGAIVERQAQHKHAKATSTTAKPKGKGQADESASETADKNAQDEQASEDQAGDNQAVMDTDHSDVEQVGEDVQRDITNATVQVVDGPHVDAQAEDAGPATGSIKKDDVDGQQAAVELGAEATDRNDTAGADQLKVHVHRPPQQDTMEKAKENVRGDTDSDHIGNTDTDSSNNSNEMSINNRTTNNNKGSNTNARRTKARGNAAVTPREPSTKNVRAAAPRVDKSRKAHSATDADKDIKASSATSTTRKGKIGSSTRRKSKANAPRTTKKISRNRHGDEV